MVVPRLINVVPGSGKAAGGESITIVGKDIDPTATVDFRLHPAQTLIAGVITKFLELPDNIQHVTVTTPVIPEASGIVGDITFFDRHVALRVTNPTTEFGELFHWEARFIDRTPAFTELGSVLFFPERMTTPTGGGALFESFTAGSDLWVQTYEFIPDGSGDVEYKAFGEFDFRPFDARFVKRTGNFGRPRNFSPFITRGQILKVQLETFPTFVGGWTVEFLDDLGFDVFQGLGVAGGPGSPVQFIPTIDDGYGDGELISIHDHMQFSVSGASPGSPPTTYGQVRVFLGLD